MNGIDAATRAAIVTARAAARRTVRAWREGPGYRMLAACLADCPAGDAGAAMARAAELLGEEGWVEPLLRPLIETLAADPLFEPPFRVSRDPLRIGAVLFESPAVTLSACVIRAAEMRRMPAPSSCTFTGRLAVTRYVRAGGATLRRWRTTPADAAFRAAAAHACVEETPVRLFDGAVVAIDGRSEAQLLADAAGDMVTLVATARAGTPLMREHAIGDGRLLRVASGDDRASRTEMLLAFLRLAGRADAGPCFEAATHDPAFHLRWAAMREWLALDARGAFPELEAMAAGDPHPEVREAAGRALAVVYSKLEAACPA